MQGDRQQQVKEVVESIEALMVAYKNKEAWNRISRWYTQAAGVQDPPSRECLDYIATERVAIYMCRTPEGLRVPILAMPATVDKGTL